MTKITKEQVLENLEDVKKYVNEVEGIAIKNRWTGDIIFQSTKTILKEAVEEAVGNGADLSKADLSGADLFLADLREASLHYADLCDADLSEADLREADLRDANLREASLHYADLCDADLHYADFRDANLRGADLYKANLSETNLQNAKFYGRGGTTRIEKSQVEDLLEALGISVNE